VRPQPQIDPNISSERIQTQAAKIVASREFSESERLRRFLQFTVEQTLRGQADQIKEYPIGVEVFGRGESFDQRTDPVVRIQAGKLRSKLERYYAGEGREDPIVIEYPKGSYVPNFTLRAAAAPTERSVPARWWKTVALATTGLLLVGFTIYWAGRIRRTTQLGAQAASIGVLPFVDMSENKDQEFFSDGITEEIIGALAKLDGLHVVARTSAFEFKGKGQDIRKIGAQLNVATLLEGSVRKSGQELRVVAQLINVADGYHLWSQTYDRKSTDVFVIQEEIAESIVNALRIRLASGQNPRLVKRYTDNPEAYRLYLQGRYCFHKPYAEEQKMAIQYFEQALALDPRYAPALAGIAEAYSRLSHRDGMPSREAITKARQAAKKALEIDEGLGEAHRALAWILFNYDWEHRMAENEYQRALELSPNDAVTRRNYAFYLVRTGRPDEGLRQVQRALELDPLSFDIAESLARIYFDRREFDNAVAQCRRLIERDPRNYFAYSIMGASLTGKQLYPEAIAALEKACALSGREALPLSGLGYTLEAMGTTGEAENILRELEERSRQKYVSPTHLAKVCMGLGKKEQAIGWLDRAFQERSLWWNSIPVDFRFDGLRSDPRFAALLKKIGLP
jgi:adenylate cyclase